MIQVPRFIFVEYFKCYEQCILFCQKGTFFLLFFMTAGLLFVRAFNYYINQKIPNNLTPLKISIDYWKMGREAARLEF